MFDLWDALNEERESAKAALEEIKELGIKKAEAEAKYQTAKNKTALLLKAEGYPATMLQMILKGDERVSFAMFERDCAVAEYDAARESLNYHKLNARFIEAQIEREWSQARRQ